jgi:hypothetical protein
VLSYYVPLRSEFRVVMSITMFCSSLPPVVCLIYVFCVCLRTVVSKHILYCLFALFFLPLVYLMLPVYLDCPFLIAPSVFSNVYFRMSYFPQPFLLWEISPSLSWILTFYEGHNCMLQWMEKGHTIRLKSHLLLGRLAEMSRCWRS